MSAEIINIREYQTTNQDDVLDLIRLNTPDYFAPSEEGDFIRYLESGRELYYVLVYDGKIVGCGGINFSNERTTGKISWDMLHPEYQGKSLGTKLLDHRIALLKSVSTIKEITVRTSQVAFKFYEKQGFEIVDIKKNYWAAGFDLYNMRYSK